MKTYLSVSVIPEPDEISVRPQHDLVTIKIGDQVSMIFSTGDGMAALDRLEEAVGEARAALLAIKPEPVPA